MHTTTPLHLRFSMPKAWLSGGKRHAFVSPSACFRHAEACRWRDKSGRQDTRSRRFSMKNRIFIPNRSRHISATPVGFFQMRSLQVAFQGHKTMKIPYKSTYGTSAQTQRRKTSPRSRTPPRELLRGDERTTADDEKHETQAIRNAY